MIEIIPSVNELSWDKVYQHIEKIAYVSDWIELDVSNGTLGAHRNWNEPGDLSKLTLTKPVRFAAHLMMRHPEKYIPEWIQAGVRRVIVQWEGLRASGISALFSSDPVDSVISLSRLCKDHWVEFGISLGKRTSIKGAHKAFPFCDIVQILAGEPGPSQQAFDEGSLARMRDLVVWRQSSGLVFKTEWDIGVNPDTIESIKKAGADIVASTSFVFNAADPVAALEYLKSKARGLI